MKRFICCLLVPAVVIVGLVAIRADKAEAHRWVRRPVVRAVVSPRPHYHYSGYYYRYYSPYWQPRVNVYAPAVRVHVGRPYGYGGTVVAPGVRVEW